MKDEEHHPTLRIRLRYIAVQCSKVWGGGGVESFVID